MGNPLLGSLADPFTAAALNTSAWNSVTGGAVTVVPSLGMAQLACPTVNGNFNTLSAIGPYDATGGMLYAQVTPVLRGNGGTRTIMKLSVDANNSVAMRLESGVFKLTMQIGGSTVTTTLPAYDPAAHAWWRLREQASTWYAETSADGFAWTTLASSSYSWSPAAVSVVLQTSASDTEPSGLFAGWQHVNTMAGAGGAIPTWPDVRFAVAFNQGANTSGQPSYVDLSSRIRQSWTAELAGRQYELDQVQSGQLSMTLWNLDGALDPLNTASPYSPNVLPLRPCRLQAVWPRSRNLIPAPYANGTAPASSWFAFTGTVAPVTGISAAPTGHTNATSWQFPITASGANARPLLTGTTSGGADATAFPVTGGAPYAASTWLSRSAGGDATLSVLQYVIFYDQSGAQVGSMSSTVTVPVLGTWIQAAATGTAPATAVSARVSYWLTNTATTAVNTLYITAVQLERGTSVTPWASGGTVYPMWAGFVERWPQQWDKNGTYGMVDITCIDALAALASFTLQPNFQASLLALGPTFVYPFTEPAGSTSFADITGRKPPRSVVPSILGSSGSITAGNSVQGAGSVGSSGPVVTITNSPVGSATNTKGLYIGNRSYLQSPPSSGGWTRVICFRTTATPSAGEFLTLWGSAGPGFFIGQPGSKAVFLLGVNDSNQGFGWVTNAAGTTTSVVAVPDVTANDGNWHIMVVQMAADGKTWTVAVDNHGYQGTTTLDYHPTGLVSDGIGALELGSEGVFQDAFAGDIAYAAEFPTAIGNPAAFDLGSGFATGWAGETSAARAQRILTMSGYLGTLRTLDATTAMGGANLADVDAMSALQLVGDTEAGQVYVDGAGVLWLASRTWRYLQNSPTITFGENQASGEVPYLGDVEIELDDTHIYNDVTVVNQPLPGAAQQPGAHIPDTTSQAAYLPRSLQRTINVQDGTVPQSAAQYLLGQYAQPIARVGALTVDPASNPALWQTLLPLGFGTRAQVTRRPPTPGGAPTITVQQFIEALTWVGDDKGNLKLQMELSPAQPYLGWWVVASLHTTVKTASTAGTATVTLNPLTGSASNPAAAVLSAGTQLTLGYGTANAETLTVQSVAATVAGYTSVAVTFTTNTAHNHAVGETVCQPLPGGVTLPTAVQAAYPSSLDAAATLSTTAPRVAY